MLSVENLSKEFHMHVRGGKRIESLKNVSFTLQVGEFLGLTGPSGIGKSSLLKCIYRTYLPSSGRIYYQSRGKGLVELSNADEHTILHLRFHEIGYVSQFLHVIPRVSAIDVVANVLVSHGNTKERGRILAGTYLKRVGIPESLWEMYPSTFSGGEKQRLNIIHALITKPRLLLLDEPTASLDAKTKREVIGLIRELKDSGTAMIGVFHDYDTLKQLADKELNLTMDRTGVVCV